MLASQLALAPPPSSPSRPLCLCSRSQAVKRCSRLAPPGPSQTGLVPELSLVEVLVHLDQEVLAGSRICFMATLFGVP